MKDDFELISRGQERIAKMRSVLNTVPGHIRMKKMPTVVDGINEWAILKDREQQ